MVDIPHAGSIHGCFTVAFVAILAPSLFTSCQTGVQGNPQAYVVSFAASHICRFS
jgi:hypothetical protein